MTPEFLFRRDMLLDTDQVQLIKLLPAARVSEFLDGRMYLNSATYFADIDDADAVRFDADEALTASWQVAQLSIQNESGEWLPIGGIRGPARVRGAGEPGLNVLCLYGLTQREDDRFDTRNLQFGDQAIVISNAQEFVRRLAAAAAAAGRKSGYGPIDYVDRNEFHGQMGPFRKFSGYSYQNEFRFVTNGGDGTPYRLGIGTFATSRGSPRAPRFRIFGPLVSPDKRLPATGHNQSVVTDSSWARHFFIEPTSFSLRSSSPRF